MNKIIALLVLSLSFLAFNAQTETKTTTTTPAPVKVAKPKKVAAAPGSFNNPLEIGISGGIHAVYGDINSRIGLDLNNSTFGVHIRKALSNNFSWRWQYNYGQASMQHFMPHYSKAVNFPGTFAGDDLWFVKSRMYSHSLAWDQVVTLGNNSMFKGTPKWIFNFFAGPAVFANRTKLNTLTNAQYSSLETVYNSAVGSGISGDNQAKRLVAEAWDKISDETYETEAASNKVGTNIEGFRINPALTFGMGLSRAISNKFNLELEQRFFYVFDDYLDGERYANFKTTPQIAQFSQMNDIVSNTTLKLNMNMGGKGTSPLYWKNSNEAMQAKLAGMNPKKDLEAALADDDRDGVPNMIDQEANSREGCPVTTKGVLMDSDKDGLVDCDDKEPFSPAGYPIDNTGVAKVPPPACCADLKKSIEPSNSTTGTSTSGGGSKATGACAESTLPTIVFEKDKFGMTSAMVPSLKTIGDKMQQCPDMKLMVNGINDKANKNGKYNEQISYNRAMEVTNYLSEKFGVSRDRFILRYNLEGTGDADADRAVMFRNAQEGEVGNGNPPSPHPGLKAGKK